MTRFVERDPVLTLPTAPRILPPAPDLTTTPRAGAYQVIYADPPWTFKRRGKAGANDRNPDRHYPTMPLAAIRALPVEAICAPDCWLFLWTSGPWLKQALSVIDAWGFAYSTRVFTWVKLKPGQGGQAFMLESDFTVGLGYTSRANSEVVLLGRRGRPQRQAKDVRELIFAQRREHSRKPDETRARILRLAGEVPRLEMFARESAPGWDSWGLETGKFDAQTARAPLRLTAGEAAA